MIDVEQKVRCACCGERQLGQFDKCQTAMERAGDSSSHMTSELRNCPEITCK